MSVSEAATLDQSRSAQRQHFCADGQRFDHKLAGDDYPGREPQAQILRAD
jgi:hypothetical protein